MVNALLSPCEIIDVSVLRADMRAYVDISKYWPKGESVNAVYEDQLMKGRKIDRRTLASAKEGKLFKSDYITQVYLRDFAREQSGDEKLTIDDLLVITDDEGDS